MKREASYLFLSPSTLPTRTAHLHLRQFSLTSISGNYLFAGAFVTRRRHELRQAGLSSTFIKIMEIREAVEEAADSQALNHIQSQIQEKLKHWSKSFANAFQIQKFEEAVTSIQRTTYYERVNEEIVKKL